MLIAGLKSNYFWYILIFLTLLAVGASFFRFVYLHDYLVSYEGDCDPYTEICFIYCEDEECSEPFYYSVIERHASEIRSLCGMDVTTCDAAYECQENVEVCSFTYCDPITDGDECELLTQDDYLPEFNDETES